MKERKKKIIGNLFNEGVLIACNSEEVCGLYIKEVDNNNIISKMIMSWLLSLSEDNELGINSLEEASKFVTEKFTTKDQYTYTYNNLKATVNYI
mgnify:FL=1|jgi:hypothetical protein